MNCWLKENQQIELYYLSQNINYFKEFYDSLINNKSEWDDYLNSAKPWKVQYPNNIKV